MYGWLKEAAGFPPLLFKVIFITVSIFNFQQLYFQAEALNFIYARNWGYCC
jgi:hypothetical protein